MSPSRKETTRGFTLVELLVVIGIIALLISILLPSLSRAREQAKRVQCASNVRQFCLTMIMYADANKGWFPDCGNASGTWDFSGNTTKKWFELHQLHPAARDMLVDYGLPRQMFFCPSNPEAPDPGSGVALGPVFDYPAQDHFAFSGYMIIGGRPILSKDVKYANNHGLPTGFEEVKAGIQPGQTIAPIKLGQKSFYPVLVADLTRSKSNELAPSNHVLGNDPTGYMPAGKGGGNVGYIDGHVEWKQQQDLGQKMDPSIGNTQSGRRQFSSSDTRFYF
jgi:prepilin-type N-terminal cleavage/methylation domain-containing protein/prepilin-type processing-associated H-X9-DG protein